MLVGNTLSPKIQATLNVGERRFLANAPLQAITPTCADSGREAVF